MNDMNYTLSFYLGDADQVCMYPIGGQHPSCILASYLGCDGIIHVTDALLMPGFPPNPLPQISGKTIYSIPAQDLGSAPNTTCNATLWEAMSAASDLTVVADSVKNNPELLQVFNSSGTAVTYFAVADQGYWTAARECP